MPPLILRSRCVARNLLSSSTSGPRHSLRNFSACCSCASASLATRAASKRATPYVVVSFCALTEAAGSAPNSWRASAGNRAKATQPAALLASLSTVLATNSLSEPHSTTPRPSSRSSAAYLECSPTSSTPKSRLRRISAWRAAWRASVRAGSGCGGFATGSGEGTGCGAMAARSSVETTTGAGGVGGGSSATEARSCSGSLGGSSGALAGAGAGGASAAGSSSSSSSSAVKEASFAKGASPAVKPRSSPKGSASAAAGAGSAIFFDRVLFTEFWEVRLGQRLLMCNSKGLTSPGCPAAIKITRSEQN